MTSSFKLILDGSVLECVSRSRKPHLASLITSSTPLRLLPSFTLLDKVLRPSLVILCAATLSLRTRRRSPPVFSPSTSIPPPAIFQIPVSSQTHVNRPQNGRLANYPIIIIFSPAPPPLNNGSFEALGSQPYPRSRTKCNTPSPPPNEPVTNTTSQSTAAFCR